MVEHNDLRFEVGPTSQESDKQGSNKKQANRVVYAGCAVVIGGFAGISGLAGYGSYRLVKDNEPRVQYSYSYQPLNERPIDRLEEYIKFPVDNPPKPEIVKQYLINNYYLGRIGLDTFSDFELKTEKSDEIKKTISEKRIKLAFLGAEILAKEVPNKNIAFDEKNGIITFEGRYFDVKNPRHLFILDELIEQNLYLLDSDKSPQEKYKASLWIEDLNWLADSQVPVQFEANDIGYPADGSLRALARFYRTLDGVGIKNLPKKIIYVPYLMDKDTGYAGGIYRSENQEIDVSESSGPDTIPHEEGHHQAYKNADFNQDKYNQLVAEAKAKTKNGYDEKDVYITPGVIDAGKMRSNVEVEDYAETMGAYFWDGVAFRRRIQELKYAKSDAAIVLEAKYDFAKLFFKGLEFTKEGEVFSVQIGDVFAISDSDPVKEPIPLRQEPMQNTVKTYYVLDTNSVKILEGPITTIFREEEVIMWKVEISSKEKDVGFVEKHDAGQGWISEGWFGEQVWANVAELFKSEK
ncbi:MAG: hypothetical protein AAB512_00985 [Patescibacteria group bacterium]